VPETGPKIAYPGEPGAYSEMAARLTGEEALPCPDFAAVFEALDSGTAAHATIPIENSLGGSLHENYDLLAEARVRILAESYQPIAHRLLGLPGATLEAATTVHSHPQALAQCYAFFRKHPHLRQVPAGDTAGAAREVAELRDPSRLAVASARAGELYGLIELERPIPAESMNMTRFLYLGGQGAQLPPWAARARGRKTSLVFGLHHKPGTLGRALAAFADRELNLTKIESRPTREKPFEYLFYVDFQGDPVDPSAQEALRGLDREVIDLRVLGTYGTL
jgi:prephenate dehydratase